MWDISINMSRLQ